MNIKTIKELGQYSIEFQKSSEEWRKVNSKEFRLKETSGRNALRLVIDGLIAKFAYNLSEKTDETNDKISYKFSLSASFIRTHFIINDLILSGDIIEALVLTRKQLESLTRLKEIDKNPLLKLLKKTPNVINTLKENGKRLYKELSEVSHFASPRIGKLLTIKEGSNGNIGPSVFPIYSDSLIEAYKIHSFISINFIFEMIGFLEGIYKNKYVFYDDFINYLDILVLSESENILKFNKNKELDFKEEIHLIKRILKEKYEE